MIPEVMVQVMNAPLTTVLKRTEGNIIRGKGWKNALMRLLSVKRPRYRTTFWRQVCLTSRAEEVSSALFTLELLPVAEDLNPISSVVSMTLVFLSSPAVVK